MARTITAGMITEVTAAQLRPALFWEGQFDSGDLNLWSGLVDISWNAKTWIGAGALLSVRAVGETEDLRAAGATFVLSGLDPTILAIAMAETYQSRVCEFWIGALDPSGAVVADPVLAFAGRMDTMTLTEAGDSAEIALTVENRLVDLERIRERHYTPEDQHIEFPGDRFFNRVAGLQNKEIRWID